jgi:alpha-ribazole phosphatase
MRIYLVRHPPPLVATGTCYGRTDLDVSEAEQSLALQALISALPKRAPVFSSPALRCIGLAAGLSRALDCPAPIHDPRLLEMDFGRWEMRSWNEIPRSEIDAWTDDIAVYRPGDGENLAQMAQRVRAFHDDLLLLNHDCAIVVCHAGTIRLLLACRCILPVADMALHVARTPHKIAYGELTVMDC